MDSSEEPHFLLLGATGQIGHDLRVSLSTLGTVVAPDRNDVDLSDPDSIRKTIHEVAPDGVVNAAGYTAVDQAEQEPERARVLNARAPGVLAEATDAVGGWLVHYSTDYVFDGEKTTPYVESDSPRPINTYGRTKWEGERAIQEVGGRYLILRTSWVYSNRRSNFLRTMLRLADERDELTVVDDQTGTPTWSGWVAEATATILGRVLESRGTDENNGLYHLSAGGQTSWYGFARAIFAQFGRNDVVVKPIASEEYPSAASRPAYSVLDSGTVREAFGLSIPTWSEQLDALRRQMNVEASQA